MSGIGSAPAFLEDYRERRTLRRAAAAALAVCTAVAVLEQLGRAWTLFESGLRLAADLLPEPDEDDEGEPCSRST